MHLTGCSVSRRPWSSPTGTIRRAMLQRPWSLLLSEVCVRVHVHAWAHVSALVFSIILHSAF